MEPTERSRNQITPESMTAFYLAVSADEGAIPIDEIDWDELD
jgi:hypothetical protein